VPLTCEMRTSFALVVSVALGVGGAACAKARAVAVVPDGPPLQVPVPPSRVLIPVEELVSTPPPPELGTAPVAVVPATSPPPAVEAKPQPAPPAASAPAPPAVPRDLRTAPVTGGDDERNVREMLAQAARDISRVAYGQLSAAGRAQYDQSKRFSAQAEQALKDRNVEFAATLAEKAATLAVELLGR
jgi:hypothetical protein